MKSPADLTDVLAKLRERFAASAANTISAFVQLAEQLQRAPAAPEIVDALRRELHRVHGTAGSYGFHEASRLAAAMELVATRWQADTVLDRARRGAIVRQFARALTSAFDGSASVGETALGHRLLLVDLDDEVASPIVAEAVHRGHFVERVTAGALEAMLDASLPQAIIATGRLTMTVPEGVALLLLQAHDGLVGAHGPRVRVLDATADPREILQVAESLAAHTGMAGATMLVVDDDPEMLAVLRAIGEGEGMFVRTLESAVDLPAAIDEFHPALLLLDISMPEVDGITATRRLRSDRRYSELPILMVAAEASAEARTAAFAAGADDLQSKPVVALELTRRIARLLEIRRQRMIARGIHPATSLLLPERTVRVFDEALHNASGEGRPMSLAVLRPMQPPDDLGRSARWHRECALVAGALSIEAARCGFLDETTLGVLLPMDAASAVARLEPFAEAAARESSAWCAGVAEMRPGAETLTRDLAHAAEEGWLSARESSTLVHRWDEADAGIPPDVIVVEDDAALSDLVGYALAARGLSYHVYRNGPDALAGLLALRVHERKPVVLMDVDLPGLDGFSLFERLRVERPGLFRVVFVSVHASEGDQLRALRAGALDYLAKPISLRVLMAKIAVWRGQDRPA